MTIKKRLAVVERRLTGGITLEDDGSPVIRLDSGHFQFEGMCYQDLKSLPPGRYALWSGPEVDFALTYDHELPWLEAISAMRQWHGAEYVPVT